MTNYHRPDGLKSKHYGGLGGIGREGEGEIGVVKWANLSIYFFILH